MFFEIVYSTIIQRLYCDRIVLDVDTCRKETADTNQTNTA